MDFSKFDFVVTGDPTKHRLLDLFEVGGTFRHNLAHKFRAYA